MLDIRYIRENADKVQQNSINKNYHDISIDELLRLDEQKRDLQQQIDELRTQRNENSSQLKGGTGRPDQATIDEGKRIKTELADREESLRAINEEYMAMLGQIPNMMKDDVPPGGEEDSVEVKRVGGQPVGGVDHLDFANQRDWVDFERGAKVAGAKFYFLKGDLALLENAITQFAMDFVIKKGFTYMTVPHMVNTRTALGAGFAPRGDKEGNEYFIDGEDLTMIGTSEAPLTGYHADEIIDEANVPLLYAGYSPCYRHEAGAAGKHTRGLFRVHQFNKLEMYTFTLPENSDAMHEKILAIEEEIWQSIGIPYHVVNIAAGDLGAPAAKKYDIEYWSPIDQAYRELTSCSNCTDFQTQNLNIRVRRADGRVEMLHSLNGTAVSLARSLVVIIENFQNDDGTLTVPEVLRPYMGGREKI